MIVKVPILTQCEQCDGKAMLPIALQAQGHFLVDSHRELPLPSLEVQKYCDHLLGTRPLHAHIRRRSYVVPLPKNLCISPRLLRVSPCNIP